MPKLIEKLKKHQHDFHPVVSFDPSTEKIISLDLSKNNTELTAENYTDTTKFSAYISTKLKRSSAKFAIGGYNENRVLYKRSALFNGKKENDIGPLLTYGEDDNVHNSIEGNSRTLHLGVDIWGPEGTEVYAPIGGMIHSFAFNDNHGDYGATLILLHQLDTVTFYTLYGHLSLQDIAKASEFEYIIRGHVIGHFGGPEENGHWPPHLHFQVIKDIGMNRGDYPGVCKWEEKKKYLANCPDPNLILKMQLPVEKLL